MPDEPQEPEVESTEGTSTDESFGMHEAFAAAEAALGPVAEGTSEARERPDEATQATPAGAGTAAEEPEHYRWAKGIEGDFDPATGKFVEDRIVKRAYELNRQNQSQAQQIQQIRQALQDPEVRAFFEARSNRAGQPAPAPQPAQQATEKTDEQVLEEFVMERANRIVAPIIERLERIAPRVEQYRQQQVTAQQDTTYAQLREEFGTEEGGGYVYDRIAPRVAEAFDSAASRLGVTRGALVSALVDRGQLYPTIRSIARDIDWERTRQSISAAQSANVDAKRRTRLSPGRGTPAGAVSPSKKIDSISDAWEAAEEQLAQRA